MEPNIEKYKNAEGSVKDVSEKGRVLIAINYIGNEDGDGDISDPGSFDATLKDMSRVKWFFNHQRDKLLGVPVEGYEEDNYVKMVAQLNMEKQLSRDTLSDYKLYAEYGRTLEHSVGVQSVSRDKQNPKHVKEWRLWEFSTLTGWGANEMTPFFGSKSISDQVDLLEKAVKMKYSDNRLKNIEDTLVILRKAITGSLIVKCPCCGLAFDYSSVQEVTTEQMIIDRASLYYEWMVQDIVREEIQKLEPEARAHVQEIVRESNVKNKSIEDFCRYVYCPKCYSRVYSHNTVEQKSNGILKSIGNKLLNK